MENNKNAVAIIGMSGVFPEAPTIGAFYQNLKSGRDSVRELSQSRMIHSHINPHGHYLVTAHMDRVDLFDHKFFDLSKKEADLMDPEQRLSLELACQAIEHAGYSLKSMEGADTGVFLGSRPSSDYGSLIEDFDAVAMTGNLSAITAGRISYYLNLTGPAMMIDTTCSSSLVAVHEACQKLISGDISSALAGGVFVIISFPELGNNISQVGILSPDGRSKTFDADANGTGGGEGGGMLFMKRLDKALEDGDTIHAVIRGGAINHDGKRSTGLTAPSPVAQSEVLIKAWKNASVAPESVAYIEAHGTGTKLGDPIEFQGISDAFKAYTSKKQFCAVSSVKTNIGHLNNAAGMAGVIKCILSLKHGELFPSLHFNKPNPYLNFDSSAAYVNKELKDWKSEGSPLRCGVSSFGLSGTNAHLVLEQSPQLKSKQENIANPANILKISAKTPTACLEYLTRIKKHLATSEDTLHDTVATLNSGRDDHAYRLAFAAADKKHLIDQLAEFENQNAKSDIATSKVTIKNLVLLFSNSQVEKSTIERLSDQHTVFKNSLEELNKKIFQYADSKDLQLFAYQYGLFHLLKATGISANTIIGTGIGKVTKQVIVDGLSVDDAIKIILSNDLSAHPLDENKYLQAVKSMVNSQQVVFLEVGSEGILSDKLYQWQENIPQITVHRLIESTKKLSFYKKVAALYQEGVNVNWTEAYPNNSYQKVEVPTYPFDKVSCWVKPALPQQSKPADIQDWFYQLEWVENKLPENPVQYKGQTFLLMMDSLGFGDALNRQLSTNNTCIQVSAGSKFQKLAQNEYTIDPSQETDYELLYKSVREDYEDLDGIFDFTYYKAQTPLTDETIEYQLQNGVYSSFFLLKAFSQYFKNNFLLSIITSGAYSLKANESVLPTQSIAAAILKGVMAEYPMIDAHHIDFEKISEDQLENNTFCILNEIGAGNGIRFVTYRNAVRYVQKLRNLPEVRESHHVSWKNKGTYLITGGARGIGFEVSKMLASQYKASKLILLGRTILSSGKEHNPADEKALEILRNIQSLEKLGTSVSYHAVDISDFEQLQKVFETLSGAVERIDGIIHAAGVPGNWEPLKDKKVEDFKSTISPKIQGTINLDQLCEPFQPDFFIAFSSLNAVVAQKNSADYAVANAFLDAYAAYEGRKNRKFISINWPGWYETGMSLKNGALPVGDQPVKPISNKDGIEALNLALELDTSNVLIGNVNLKLFRINPFFQVQEIESVAAEAETISSKNTNIDESLTPVQAKIKNIWRAVLNEDNFTIEEDFFEIGGHSLNGMQVINRVHEEFNVELEIENLFEFATIKDLATFVEEKLESGTVNAFEAISAVAESDHYELTHAQKRLWVLNQLEKNSNTYNMPLAFALEGLDEQVFEKALYKLVERHESFRTAFVVVNGEPRQKIIPFQDHAFKIAYQDAYNISEEELQQQVDQESSIPFDLEKGKLLRTKLFRTGDSKHILVFTVHHIISDGWSMRLIVNELAGLYNAFLNGQADPLPELKIQYKDFASWQNEQLSDENILETRTYWLDQFKGDIPKLDLPTDYPRPAVRSFDGDMHTVVIPQAIVDQLNKFNIRQGTSLYMNLLAVLYILLNRYTGQKDIVVGSPILGRPHKDLEGIVGFFLNNLSLRIQLESDETFTSLLKKVKNLTLNAYEHQNYPFDRLVDDLNMQVDRSRHPLFDVVLTENVELSGGEEVKMSGVTTDLFNTGFRSNMVDLRIIFSKVKDGLALSFDYNKKLFATERIEQMAAHFEGVLNAVVHNENTSIARLDYLSEEEKTVLLNGQEYKNIDYPTDKTLYQLFEAQVQKMPDQVAVVSTEKTLTYDELNQSANQLAHFLRQSYDVKKDQVIGLMLERSEYVSIGMLGILKSGAAFLPIDPSLPAARKELLLSQAGVEVLLIDSENMLELEGYQGELVALDIQLAMLDTPTTNLENIGAASTDLAYVIYTSGSSGVPKGVLIEHRSIVNIVLDHIDQLSITPKDRVLQFASISFDVSVCESFMALLAGAAIVLPTGKMINEHTILLDYMDQKEVTIGVFTASFYHALDLERLKKLRAFIIGGEAPDPSKIIYSSEYSTMLNAYGPTECAVCITTHKVNDKDKKKVSIPIGKPIANTKILVLDKNMQLVPNGIKGEIYAAGAGLARGYLNDAKQTDEKFIKNPFDEAERLYKTGDEGSWSFDKELRIFGRSDQQVKVRGHRIELGEIEKALSTYPEINSVGVLVKQEGSDNQLIGFYSAENALKVDQIKTFLSARLPYYMVPGQLIHVAEIPLTTNGKVDARKLLELSNQYGAESEYVAPESETQKKLVDIWEEVLGRKEIGIEDNFFELGGHSLKATQLISRIIEKLNVNIEVVDIFTYPTVRELANIVDNLSATDFSKISQVEPQEYYEVSHAQKRLWILSQFEENATAYNLPVTYKFKGKLEGEALAEAFNDILQRHEILRTTFVLVDEQPMQKVHEVESFNFKLDISDLKDAENPEKELNDLVREDLTTVFDLEKGPLFKARLFQAEEECFYLTITVHHIIADAWSLALLINEIAIFYNARVSGQPHDMPALPIQYKDYAAWQNQQFVDTGMESDRQYWHQQFEGELPVLELPTDFARPAQQTYDGSHVKHVLEAEISEGLRKLSKNSNASLFIILLSAFKALCHRYTGDSDIIVGTPIAGRNHADLESQVGFYVNTLAIRTQFESGYTFEQLLEAVKKNVLDSQKHQLYPFDKLVEELDLDRDTSRSPLFNVMLDMHVDDSSEVSINLEGVSAEQVEPDFEISKFDLSFTFVDTNDRIIVGAEYNTNLFRAESITRLLQHYNLLLQSILDDSHTALNELNYITPAESEQLEQFSQCVSVDYDGSKTLQQLFEERVKANPEKTALIFEGLEMTYESLNEKANRFAEYLNQHHQIQANQLVGILLNRSENLLVAILGILKAGAAYLPIDPQNPEQRIIDICNDSKMPLLITSKDFGQSTASLNTNVVYIDEEMETISSYAGVTTNTSSASDLAYCIYTSGSTGRPKGITIQHQSIVNYIQWANRYYFDDQSGYNFPLITPVSFDLTLTSMFSTLLRGDSLVIYKEANIADILMEACADDRIGAIKLTPSHIELMEGLGIQETQIKCAIVGGEALTSSQVNILLELNPGMKVYNEYGPTETTVGCTVKRLAQDEPITIGKPIDNVSAYIFDQNLNATPVGVNGELYIGGDGLAAGYLNQPALTAEKFIRNPKNKEELLYHTGDIAHWTATGEISFIGRVDTQLKIRGHRIEPGEIEQALLQLKEVEQAVVSVNKDNQQDSHLAAFIRIEPDTTFDPDRYRTYLSSKLPAYMVPSFYVHLEEIPLTSNGKVDYKALHYLDHIGEDASEKAEPVTEIQTELVEIWKEVLGLDSVGIYDNFFHIGGHSLKAIQATTRISDKLDMKLSLSIIFRMPTVAALAQEIEAMRWIQDDQETELESHYEEVEL
ncbi:amino acid adenylation domain-containing protein [Fulvivirga sp. 29W222]|uniref:Amino acid adenylation domain-containing protein n=1 Tax=Fulvivirga marina TaxID=2494733 RepID=A0A937KG96_9BACT|nr:non-ribosomal peptide synthetase [Fulvivirga marina]MBL6449165.1 amino acid adenylation domain-containing protein [Fulvivirga marina]